MIIRTTVKATINPEALQAACTKAEHAVAVQAERDTRPFITSGSGRLRSSGRVHGNTIVWDLPYAKLQYFGKVYVDPIRKIAAYPVADGWRSFAGRKKIRSQRNFRHTTGGPQWFTRAKRANVGKWYILAKGVIERG